MAAGKRIEAGIERGHQIEIEVDGETIAAYEGESIAAALLASGRRTFRHSAKLDAPRGLFCGMGVCFDCLMTVDGVRNVRTCVTPVQAGMKVQTQHEHAWLGGA